MLRRSFLPNIIIIELKKIDKSLRDMYEYVNRPQWKIAIKGSFRMVICNKNFLKHEGIWL